MQDVAETDAPQQDERQRDVNGVLGLIVRRRSSRARTQYPPAGEQSKRITVVTAIADDGGDGEDDGDRLIDEQHHEEERRRLAAALRQEPPPGAKRVANPCDTGRVGEEAGKAENDGGHGGDQKRGQLAAQRAQPAPDRPVRHGQRGGRDPHDYAHHDSDCARSSGVGGPGDDAQGNRRAAGAFSRPASPRRTRQATAASASAAMMISGETTREA